METASTNQAAGVLPDTCVEVQGEIMELHLRNAEPSGSPDADWSPPIVAPPALSVATERLPGPSGPWQARGGPGGA